MFVFWRYRCHACGTRSQHAKSNGVMEFRCTTCSAWNYIGINGEYLDPPTEVVTEQNNSHLAKSSMTVSKPSNSIFCSTCVRNQQISHELLSNYLPDEDHPQYEKYERELPAYKTQLEQRYPQICKDCAPKAQSIIHEADYYSMTHNTSQLLQRSRGGRRSASPISARNGGSAQKTSMRLILDVLGSMRVLSALYQIMWHIFAILELRQDFSQTSASQDWYSVAGDSRKVSQCVEEISRLDFSYPCFRMMGLHIPKSLLITLCLTWYNNGLSKLYDPRIRMAKVKGWQQHLGITISVLFARTYAWIALRNVITSDLSLNQLYAAHTVSIVLIVVGHLLANSSVRAEKWKVTGSIMPRPEERDILGRTAGPAPQKCVPKVSETDPRALSRDTNRFPIENLAPRQTRAKSRVLPPSPPGSDGDPMDIEPTPPAQSQAFGKSIGWDHVRTNLFTIDDEMRAKQEQRRRIQPDDKHMYFQPPQPSPFRATLPQAPMSQERRLRNPVSQIPQFRVPVTQRQDFLQQMKDGIDANRRFRDRSVDSDSTEVSTAAASRTRGQLELDKSDWHLQSDLNAATGLEDIFEGSFNIEDPKEVLPAPSQQPIHQQRYSMIATALVAVLLAFAFDIAGVRRSVCMFLVRRLDALGY